tara:strand:+ start:5084 stop:5455 length:372 start_codon:yes stop_codon:yes gene_type:complete
MGKKSRKLRSPKYAQKAAALRETVAKLRGQVGQNFKATQETVQEIAEKIEEPAKPKVNALKQMVKKEEPVVEEQPKVEQPKVEQPKVEQPKVEKPKTTRKPRAAKKTTSTTRKRRPAKTKTEA